MNNMQHFKIIGTISVLVLIVVVGLCLLSSYADSGMQEKEEASARELLQAYQEQNEAKNYKRATELMEQFLAIPNLTAKRRFNAQNKLCGHYWYDLSDYKNALKACTAAVNQPIPDESRDDSKTIQAKTAVLVTYGSLQDEMGHSKEAIKSFEAAASLLEKLGDAKSIEQLNTNFGLAYNNLNDTTRTKYYFAKVAAQLEKSENFSMDTYNSLAFAYRHLEEFDKAIEYGKKGLEAAKLAKDEEMIACIDDTLADIYYAKKDYANALTHAEAMIGYQDKKTLVNAIHARTYGLILAKVERKEEACSYLEKSTQLYLTVPNETEAARNRQYMGDAGCGA